MKCGACGYQYVHKTTTVEEVDYFKSGKRKGEIKGVKSRDIEFEVGHTEFQKLGFERDIDRVGVTSDGYYNKHFEEVELYVCPECGTVRVGEM